MGSSASDLLKLELQAVGENASTWGAKASILFERFEQSIAGRDSITLAGGTYTLDDTQYVKGDGAGTAESHFWMIEAVGSPGATRDIVVPTRVGRWLFYNNTGDSSSMQVKTSGGSGITIANGYYALLYSDGTDVLKAFSDEDFGITSLAGDASPQLAADLDTNGNNIQFDDANGIDDDSGNEHIRFQSTGSAVNQFDITNAATGSGPSLDATGDDANIDLNINAKGAGEINLDDTNLADNFLIRPKLKDISELVKVHGNLNGATNASMADGNVHTFTVTGAFTLTITDPPASGTLGSITFIITNGSSSVLTWDPQIIWAGGAEPELTAAGIDVVTVLTTDAGTTIFGFPAGLDMS